MTARATSPALYDENGNVDAAYEYDPYGRIVKQSGSYAE